MTEINIYNIPKEPTAEEVRAWVVKEPFQFPQLPTRLRVWSFVYWYQFNQRQSPTLEEIADACDFKGKSNAAGHLTRLQRDGILLRAEGARKEIHLKEHPAANPLMRNIIRMNELALIGKSEL
jgi:hypothetical protein